jgi:hypothetical protein
MRVSVICVDLSGPCLTAHPCQSVVLVTCSIRGFDLGGPCRAGGCDVRFEVHLLPAGVATITLTESWSRTVMPSSGY